MPRRYINPYAKLLAVEFWKRKMALDNIKKTLHINFSLSLIYRWVELFEKTGCVI
jgi:hypothetical protein